MIADDERRKAAENKVKLQMRQEDEHAALVHDLLQRGEDFLANETWKDVFRVCDTGRLLFGASPAAEASAAGPPPPRVARGHGMPPNQKKAKTSAEDGVSAAGGVAHAAGSRSRSSSPFRSLHDTCPSAIQARHTSLLVREGGAASQHPSSPGALSETARRRERELQRWEEELVQRERALISETARRERELQRLEEELVQRERALRRREGLLSVQQEQTDAVVKVKRERLASSATQVAKLESDLRARATELAGLKSAAVAIADRIKQAEQEFECPICMDRSATTALNPCGHCFCCCEDCGSVSAAVCPICSQAVESRTRLFGAKLDSAIAADLALAAAAVGGGGQYGADISRAGAATALNDSRRQSDAGLGGDTAR